MEFRAKLLMGDLVSPSPPPGFLFFTALLSYFSKFMHLKFVHLKFTHLKFTDPKFINQKFIYPIQI